MFTSLLNTLFSYDPIGYGLPYNYLMFTDSREPLVEVASQILCVVLESNIHLNRETNQYSLEEKNSDSASKTNLFINYVSRIHRDEVSIFISTFSVIRTFIYINLIFSKGFQFHLERLLSTSQQPNDPNFLALFMQEDLFLSRAFDSILEILRFQ